MTTYVIGAVWVAAAAVLAGLVGYLVRRFGLDEGRPGNNDAAGQVFVIVSGMHAVVLAFVMVTLFDSVSAAREGAHEEARNLVAASWAAQELPEPAASRVRAIATDYASSVVRNEWPEMRAGSEVGDRGWQRLDRMRRIVMRTDADGEWEENRKAEAIDRISTVYELRQQRLTRAFHREVTGTVWFVLVLGGILVVLLPNLFGGTRLFPHVMIVSTLEGTLALLLFAIHHLQNPFAGDSRIAPEAFRWALERLR